MDVFSLSSSSPDLFRIDDLLDFSNEELFSSSSLTNAASSSSSSPPEIPFGHSLAFTPSLPTDFTADLCVPNDDVAQLEWLSQFVDDSFSDYPVNPLTMTARSESSLPGRVRSKRSRGTSAMAAMARSWTSPPKSETATETEIPRMENYHRMRSPTPDGGPRRCTHCASDKTPQWRSGPLGPKTLCNACGVRFKSGRLVPEYRPASSPTFVLTQHSNSHRKVLELRRQKEHREENHVYRDFDVC